MAPIEFKKIFKTDELEAYLASIVEGSDDAIISKSLDGYITSWNPAAERVFGYTAKEAVGRNIGLIIPYDRMDEEYQILDKLKRGERIDHFETIRHRKDGKPIDVSLTVSPIRDQSGKIIGASKIARDISKAKCAERIVHLAAIVESAGDAIISVNLNGIITSWNAAAERLFGYTSREAIGHPISLICPAPAPEEHALSLLNPKRLLTMRRTKDGRVFDALITLSPVQDREGAPAGLSEIIHPPSNMH
jgi:PAS domain S-box-containing protein